MEKQQTNDFLLDVAGEESDAASFQDLERPEETVWPAWSGTVRIAWASLRDDRFYGSMGGQGRIYYSSLSRYAQDHGIPIQPFATFVMALDDEYCAVQNEKAQADADKREEEV